VAGGIPDDKHDPAAGAGAAGAGYTRHSDAAHGKNIERVLTCILYLNDGWNHARDGGCLRVWPKAATEAPVVRPTDPLLAETLEPAVVGAVHVEFSRPIALESAWFQPLSL
jgi:Rps23 Pro-64 3,4-dihydroxylase Tpa1-like proline 4-hydroxylase